MFNLRKNRVILAFERWVSFSRYRDDNASTQQQRRVTVQDCECRRSEGNPCPKGCWATGRNCRVVRRRRIIS